MLDSSAPSRLHLLMRYSEVQNQNAAAKAADRLGPRFHGDDGARKKMCAQISPRAREEVFRCGGYSAVIYIHAHGPQKKTAYCKCMRLR